MARADSILDADDLDAGWEAADPLVVEPPRSGARGVVLEDSLRSELSSWEPERPAPGTDAVSQREPERPPTATPASRLTTVRTRSVTPEPSAGRRLGRRVALAAVAGVFVGGSLGAWLTMHLSAHAPSPVAVPEPTAVVVARSAAPIVATPRSVTADAQPRVAATPMPSPSAARPGPPSLVPKGTTPPKPAASVATGPRPLKAPPKPAPSSRPVEAPAKK